MKLSHKILLGVIVPFVLTLILVGGASAQKLPDERTVPPTVAGCGATEARGYTGAGPIGNSIVNTALGWFGLNSNAGYLCEHTNGGKNYLLFYDANQKYLGAVDINTRNAYNNVGVSQNVKIGEDAINTLRGVTQCNGLNFLTNIVTCGWRALNVGLGTLSMSVNAWLLGIAGLLFDWLVGHTIVTFGSSFYTAGVQTGINIGWTVFRDIANILIIGLFVFIAISIILGLKEYGQKKYIARIIIIAILINFSLLFTKMIVDFSNFTARQFYYAATASGLPATNTGASGINSGATGAAITDFADKGIAGKFIAMTGVGGVLSTTAKLWEVAQSQQSGWLALLHGVFAGSLFLAAALVLFYGSYILLARAVIILFLLLTSSLAFATYIIPYRPFVDKGWTLWWSSLIKTAVLAPLLMLFLWATIKIVDGISATCTGTQCATLNSLTTSADASNISVLFNYLIVLGLLFASFKVSNSIASGIAGMNFAAMAATIPFAIGSKFLGAPLLRQTLGRFAMGAEERKMGALKESRADLSSNMRQMNELKGVAGKEAEYKRLQALTKQQGRESARLARQATRRGNLAASKMNVMDTGVAKTWTKTVGLKGVLSGQSAKTTESYSGYIDRLAKDAAKAAERVAPSRDDENKVRDSASAAYREENAGAARDKQVIADQLKAAVTSLADRHKDATDKLNADLIKAVADRDGAFKQERERMAEAEANITTIKSRNPGASEATNSDLRHENMRIKAAQAEIIRLAKADGRVMSNEDISKKAREVDILSRGLSDTRRDYDRAQQAAEEFVKSIEANAKLVGNSAVNALRDAAVQTAEEIGRRGVGVIPNILDPERVAAATLKKFRTKTGKDQRLKDVLKDLEEDETPPPTEPITPPTTT